MVYKIARAVMLVTAAATVVMAGHDLAVGTLSLGYGLLAVGALAAVRGLWILYAMMEESSMG